MGGVRYSKVDVSAAINANLFGLTGSVHGSGDKIWRDPYIGARVLHRIDERWTLIAYGDVGGFGVGWDLTWQALAE